MKGDIFWKKTSTLQKIFMQKFPTSNQRIIYPKEIFTWYKVYFLGPEKKFSEAPNFPSMTFLMTNLQAGKKTAWVVAIPLLIDCVLALISATWLVVESVISDGQGFVGGNWASWKKIGRDPGSLGDLLGIILASYIGIIVNHYQDPY